MATPQEQVLSVPDISCEHCVNTINKAVGGLAGVESVSTDIPTKTVRLRYDPSLVSMEKIEETLGEAGYTISK